MQSEADVDASRAAASEIDFDRLTREPAYAAEMMAHLDRIAAASVNDAEVSLAVDSLRLIALVTLDRDDEAKATIDRIISRRPTDPDSYGGPLYAAEATEDLARAVEVVEAASRNVPSHSWAQLRNLLARDATWPLLSRLEAANEKALRVRLAAALFRIGWPAIDDAEATDQLRVILLEDRLERGDEEEAVEFASGLTTPLNVLPMIVQPRYDRILAPGRDRLELLRETLAERDRVTRDALERAPNDFYRLLNRIAYLRGVGRNAEALTLLGPRIRDVRATIAADRQGAWLINEAAYALLALGRGEEAVSLMRELVAVPVASNPQLIGPAINFTNILVDSGRYAEALEHGSALERGDSRFANDYGKMWIAAHTLCALVGLDRMDETRTYLERLRAHEQVNPSALSLAYLCLGDEESAAALMIRRLQEEDPSQGVLALQDYALSSGPSQTGGVYARLVALRQRPDVRAAFDSVARHFVLPLTRTYWGGF